MTHTRDERGSITANALGLAAAVVGLVTALLAFVPTLRPWAGDVEGGGSGAARSIEGDIDRVRAPADVFLNRDSGPAGTVVKVSGEGFAPGESVELRLHTSDLGRTTTNDAGSFANVSVTIPGDYSDFAPQRVDVVAPGRTSIKSARAPFTVTG